MLPRRLTAVCTTRPSRADWQAMQVWAPFDRLRVAGRGGIAAFIAMRRAGASREARPRVAHRILDAVLDLPLNRSVRSPDAA